MTGPDDSDPIADWLAIRVESGPQPNDDARLLEEIERAEDCARMLARLGETYGTSIQPGDDEPGGSDAPLVPRFDVGRFQIERLVGRGGMGNVFLAFDPVLQRKVALKIPRLDLRAEPELQRRFLREARATALLAHPNLVPILEIGEDGPSIFLVLAWCDGPNLGEWLAEQSEPLEPRWAAALVAELAETLEHCHRQGVIHRDLKPSNILLDNLREDDPEVAHMFPFTPKITDFGLARTLEASMERTDSSLLLGTPHYMAPEQCECRHEDVGPHTDVYALGVILFQLLTRKTPFQETTAIRVIDQIRQETPPSISQIRRDVARDLQVICEKCLHKRPEDRYRSAAELAADLRRFSRGECVAARPLSLWTRFDRWLQRPERFANAALVMIVVHAIIVGWMAVVTYEDVFGVDGLPLEYSAPVAVGRVVVLATFVHGIPIGLSFFVFRKRRWALVSATLLAVLLWLWVTTILLGMPAPFPGYEERPALKTRTFGMLEALALAQLVGLLLAQRAKIPDRAGR